MEVMVVGHASPSRTKSPPLAVGSPQNERHEVVIRAIGEDAVAVAAIG